MIHSLFIPLTVGLGQVRRPSASPSQDRPPAWERRWRMFFIGVGGLLSGFRAVGSMKGYFAAAQSGFGITPSIFPRRGASPHWQND